MYKCERHGLNELKKGELKIPDVLFADDRFILMEFLETGSLGKKTYYNFGKKLAGMHKIKSSVYGFSEDNFIGSSPQKNNPMPSWVDFYFENRLKFQYQMAESKKMVNAEIKSGFLNLEKKLPKLLSNEGGPSLLHGDLWSGNIFIDGRSSVCLIDPAVYYGNREAEFGILTLFGGVEENEFFKGYNEEFPLKEGWEERNKIYQLYHLFNHLNLFGMGYSRQIIEILKYFN
jgi:fructosamine-3-kinase